MELRLLRYFVTVAEERHFGRAAARLHIAQPALSQQIRSLEHSLGVQLLERTTRKVEITDPGRMLLDEANRILRRADSLEHRMRRVAAGELGVLRVGFVNSAAFDALPRIVRAFQEAHPHVGLELTEMTTTTQLNEFSNGNLDVGIGRDAVPDDATSAGVTVSDLTQERLIVAVPSRHPLAAKRRVAAVDLAGEALIALPASRAPGVYQAVEALCAGAGFRLTPTLTALQFTTALGLTAAGLGLTVVPECARSFHPSGLTFRPLTDDHATSSVQLLTRQSVHFPALDQFTQLAKQGAPPLHDAAN